MITRKKYKVDNKEKIKEEILAIEKKIEELKDRMPAHSISVEMMQELENLFNKGYSACETAWSERPSIELAVSKITKRYKKIQKAALTISNDTPDSAIHSIRIDCKKLRYRTLRCRDSCRFCK